MVAFHGPRHGWRNACRAMHNVAGRSFLHLICPDATIRATPLGRAYKLSDIAAGTSHETCEKRRSGLNVFFFIVKPM
jgi:hypothetical protein